MDSTPPVTPCGARDCGGSFSGPPQGMRSCGRLQTSEARGVPSTGAPGSGTAPPLQACAAARVAAPPSHQVVAEQQAAAGGGDGHEDDKPRELALVLGRAACGGHEGQERHWRRYWRRWSAAGGGAPMEPEQGGTDWGTPGWQLAGGWRARAAKGGGRLARAATSHRRQAAAAVFKRLALCSRLERPTRMLTSRADGDSAASSHGCEATRRKRPFGLSGGSLWAAVRAGKRSHSRC